MSKEEALVSRELNQAFIELIGTAASPDFAPRALESQPLAIFLSSISVLIFATLAAAAGYSLGTAGRMVSIIQLVVLSLLFEALFISVLKSEGRPLTLVLSLVLAWSGGILLKHWDGRRRQLENQYYELKLRNRELMESRLALVKQDETERRLLAADLHDQVLNDLKALKSKIDRFADSKDPSLPDEIRTLLNQAMNEIRNIMDSLSPVVLEHFGLASAVEECLERGAARANFEIEFSQDVPSDELKSMPMVTQQLVYRLVQESITNICKHAQASSVGASLAKEGKDLVIRIYDDGKGMDMMKASDTSRGLRYMRLRAGLIGGNIAWQSPNPGNGKGTLVEIRCPLD